MKTTRHPTWLRLLLVLLSVWTGFYTTRAELPPDSEPTDLHTHATFTNFGKFDGHGRLLFQDGIPARWHDTLVHYPRGSNDSVKLSRDLSAINVFLAAEVHQSKTVRTFIKKYLTFFLRVNLEFV